MEKSLFKIRGKIIDSNNKGIENLIVVFYDTDKKLNLPGDNKQNIIEIVEKKGSERLGSTYTKEDGAFEFVFNYQDFAPQKEEKRPDILAIVLSAEKEESLKERVLYVSEKPILNGGRDEALLIIISDNRRDGLINTSHNSETKIDSILKSVEVNENEERLIKKHIAPKIAKNLRAKKDRKGKSSLLFQNLSTIAKKNREHNKLLLSQTNTLEKATKYSIENGVNRFQFDLPTLMNIHISKEDKKKLGIEDQTNPINEISIPYNKYCGLMSKKTKGKTLIKEQSLKEIIYEVLNKEDKENQLEDESGSQNTSDPENQNDSGVTVPVIEEGEEIKFIKDKISEVYTPVQNTLNNSVLHASVKTRVNFDQDISAANQKAFHDFHSLQMAFENVWKEAFDKKISKKIESIFGEVIAVLEEYKLEGDVKESYDEVKKLLDGEKDSITRIISFLNDKADLVGEGIPVPKKLVKLNFERETFGSSKSEEELKDNWELLSINQQNQIIDILSNTNYERYSMLKPEEKKFFLLNIVKEDTVKIIKYKLADIKWSSDSEEWNEISIYDAYKKNIDLLDRNLKHFVKLISENMDSFNTNLIEFNHPGLNLEPNNKVKSQYRPVYFSLKEYVEDNVDIISIKHILKNPKGIKSRVSKLINDINQRLLDPYAFHVFAKDSVNYGIMTTYRQEWTPSNWQVGDLVSTMPLTPGEKRKFTKRLKVKKSRSQKEVESSLSRHTDDVNYVTKAHTEIFKKTNTATNFSLNIEGSLKFDAKIVDGGIKTVTGYKNDQATESSAKKKSIREFTKKAASEFKNERSIEIVSKEDSDFEESTSGEISNPNNEITVTYLFYELERQYTVSEKLHKLTPVVLVAFDVPPPHEVDEDWLLAHEWILRRILLDDSFHEAFDYLREGLLGDEINYEAAKGHYHLQKEIVNEISANVSSLMALRSRLQSKFNTATDNKNIVGFHERKRDSAKTDSIFGAIFNPAQLFLTLPEYDAARNELNGQYDSEFYEAERKALESRVSQIREELAATEEELVAENNALEKAKNQMMAFTTKISTKRNLINQLRIHVKQNILYYMQGIWEHEPPDQRFFRLYNVEASMPKPSGNLKLEIRNGLLDVGSSVADRLGIPWTQSTGSGVYVNFPKPTGVEKKPLHEIADVDNLLGFKGNYAIFPLKTCTYITDFMMKDYIDEYLNLKDPDFDGEISTEDLESIYTRIKERDEYKEFADRISEIITARKSNPVIKDETIVVPTGQLYIEALPGKHALLEDFKLKHRAMDVLKVQEEVREAQIENLRKSARIIENKLDDPDIDRRIEISGNDDIIVNP